MRIEIATKKEYEYLRRHNEHIPEYVLKNKIDLGEILIALEEDQRIGLLTYGYFWDYIPFMNMLWIEVDYRGQEIGKKLVEFWEQEMKVKGNKKVMTSTLSNENAQHFYRKLGYREMGNLLFEGEAMELVFLKNI